MDDFWEAPRCRIPVIIESRHVRWCHLENEHADDEHETIWDSRKYRWPNNERSTTP